MCLLWPLPLLDRRDGRRPIAFLGRARRRVRRRIVLRRLLRRPGDRRRHGRAQAWDGGLGCRASDGIRPPSVPGPVGHPRRVLSTDRPTQRRDAAVNVGRGPRCRRIGRVRCAVVRQHGRRDDVLAQRRRCLVVGRALTWDRAAVCAGSSLALISFMSGIELN